MFMDALLESNRKVFFNIFLSEFIVRHVFFPVNSPGELFHRLFSRGEASNRKTCKISKIKK